MSGISLKNGIELEELKTLHWDQLIQEVRYPVQVNLLSAGPRRLAVHLSPHPFLIDFW